jgi:hypothetical protein
VQEQHRSENRSRARSRKETGADIEASSKEQEIVRGGGAEAGEIGKWEQEHKQEQEQEQEQKQE